MRAAALAVRDEADTVREEEELKALLSVSAEVRHFTYVPV